MKTSKIITLSALMAVATVIASCGGGPAPTGRETKETTPTLQGDTFKAADANEQILFGNTVRAAVWGISAVNYDAMYQAFVRDAKGSDNQFVYWSKPSNWKNQLLTPNADALYLLPFFNTKQIGPIVIEVPPADKGSIVGVLMDCWQTPLDNVGIAGLDKGKGGKYLILPPGYTGKVPTGYFILPSDCYQGYGLLRSIPKTGSEADIAAAVVYMKRIKIYPLSAAANPPQSVFNDVTDVLFDANIYYDDRYFQSLDRIVQSEDWIDRDKAMIDVLKSIGMEKGKAFEPTGRTKEIIAEALKTAHQWLDGKYEAIPGYYPNSHWFWPIPDELIKGWAVGFNDKNNYPVDARGLMFYWGFSSSKISKGDKQNQLYLFAGRDKDGNALDGNANYHLKVTADMPAEQYWSATLYNRATHTLIRDVSFASRSSLQKELVRNADGTVDLYFGPEAPAGKESNWVPTKKGENFEIIFRLYGATKPIFDKTWVLPDVEKVK